MPKIRFLKEQVELARRLADVVTSRADRERFLAAADDYQHQIDAATVQWHPMISVDRYRQELRSQMDRAVTYGATEILINGGELCRTLGRGYRRDANACGKAMRDELKPGDIVFIDEGAGVGMTVRYLLPRKWQ
jgi:hypothetical protein